MLKNRQKSDFDDFLDCIIIESVHNPNPSASGFDRLARKVPTARRRRRRMKPLAEAASRARARNAKRMVNGHPFSEQIQGAVALGRFQNPERQPHPKAALRPAAASGGQLRQRTRQPNRNRQRQSFASADLQVQNRKRRRASPSASTGDQDWPRAVRRPHAHGSRARSPQPEMPERTHATANPSASGFDRLARKVPTARRRRRRIETAGRGAASRAREKRKENG